MAKKYIYVRMPLEVYNLYLNKKKNMERDLKYITGKRIPLTMPKVFKLVGNNPTEIERNHLLNIAKKKRGEL